MQQRAEGEAKLAELGLIPLKRVPVVKKKKEKAVFSANQAPPTRTVPKRAKTASKKVAGKSKAVKAIPNREGLLTDESDQEVIPTPKRRPGFQEQEQAQCIKAPS
jgi:hypothetical protein